MLLIHDDLMGDECPVEGQRVVRTDVRQVSVGGIVYEVCKACAGRCHRE